MGNPPINNWQHHPTTAHHVVRYNHHPRSPICKQQPRANVHARHVNLNGHRDVNAWNVNVVHQGAGISKKSKNGRKSVLSAKEKGLDRAEAVIDKKEIKIEKSKDRARTVQERAKNWEELNKKMLAEKAREEALALEKEKENEEWQDAE